MARLLFIGRLEDIAGAAECSVRLEAPVALSALLAQLPGELAQALDAPRVRMALNGVLAPREGLVIAEADELAFLPPVSGG